MLSFANFDFISTIKLARTSQEIGWEEHLRYDRFSVEFDVKPQLSQEAGTKRETARLPAMSGTCVYMYVYRKDGCEPHVLVMQQASSSSTHSGGEVVATHRPL